MRQLASFKHSSWVAPLSAAVSPPPSSPMLFWLTSRLRSCRRENGENAGKEPQLPRQCAAAAAGEQAAAARRRRACLCHAGEAGQPGQSTVLQREVRDARGPAQRRVNLQLCSSRHSRRASGAARWATAAHDAAHGTAVLANPIGGRGPTQRHRLHTHAVPVLLLPNSRSCRRCSLCKPIFRWTSPATKQADSSCRGQVEEGRFGGARMGCVAEAEAAAAGRRTGHGAARAARACVSAEAQWLSTSVPPVSIVRFWQGRAAGGASVQGAGGRRRVALALRSPAACPQAPWCLAPAGCWTRA